MAATMKKNKRKTACFLGCFGFFEEMIPGKIDKNSRKSTCWFSSSRFRLRKIDTKTVPVDSPATDHKTASEPVNYTPKSYETKKIIPPGHGRVSSNQQPPRKIPAVPTVAGDNDTKRISREDFVIETRKSLDNSEVTKDDEKNPNRLPFRRKIDPTTRTVSSQPGSPDVSDARTKQTRTASLSQSIPLLATSRDVEPVRPKKKKIGNGNGEKIEPIVGLSIVILTLLIMILWGRLCAILCTSAWCYCVSCVRTGSQRTIISSEAVWSSESGEPDLSSSEYKKKVVLEGFIVRNHRYK